MNGTIPLTRLVIDHGASNGGLTFEIVGWEVAFLSSDIVPRSAMVSLKFCPHRFKMKRTTST
jgi:hypothetical protein